MSKTSAWLSRAQRFPAFARPNEKASWPWPPARTGQAMSYPPVDPFGEVDPQRLAIQRDLYNTQFYKGRTDGRAGDEDRMKAAITLVQINAGLPETGIYDDAVHHAIQTFVSSGGQRWTDAPPATTSPPPSPPPMGDVMPTSPAATSGFGTSAKVALALAGAVFGFGVAYRLARRRAR